MTNTCVSLQYKTEIESLIYTLSWLSSGLSVSTHSLSSLVYWATVTSPETVRAYMFQLSVIILLHYIPASDELAVSIQSHRFFWQVKYRRTHWSTQRDFHASVVLISELSGGGIPEADVGGIAEKAMQAEVRKNMTNPWTLKAGAVGQSRWVVWERAA